MRLFCVLSPQSFSLWIYNINDFINVHLLIYSFLLICSEKTFSSSYSYFVCDVQCDIFSVPTKTDSMLVIINNINNGWKEDEKTSTDKRLANIMIYYLLFHRILSAPRRLIPNTIMCASIELFQMWIIMFCSIGGYQTA